MPWEARKGRLYYYRKERAGARVRSVYVGAGATAAILSRLDSADRAGRDKAQAAERRARKLEGAEDAALDALARAAEASAACALTLSGFHCRKGEWRLRRRGTGEAGSSRTDQGGGRRGRAALP